MIDCVVDRLFGSGAQLSSAGVMRRCIEDEPEISALVDELQARCLYLRSRGGGSFALEGAYRLLQCAAGGWLLESVTPSAPSYWVPVAPMLRQLDAAAHIVEEQPAVWSSFQLSPQGCKIGFPAAPDGWVRDCIVWQLADPALTAELQNLAPIETQGYFLLGSHTCYRKPVDLYRHLVHGHIYEDRYAWPHHRKVCSENDAHALWQIFAGLEHVTGKRIYKLLKRQVLLAVLNRQGDDGGFRHGEWTDDFESHYRLHCSGMHLLMDALEDEALPEIQQSLQRAAAFLARTTDKLACGRWFLHDELELSPVSLAKGPARYIASRAFGKSVSNLLVLNTHLDSTIALDRYGSITGDLSHQSLVAEANRATDQVLASRPAEHLYRFIFILIELTFLPTDRARRLPIWQRALKRIAWKYLLPNLVRFKHRFPRLVMPGGYIDRELSSFGFAHDYHAVNLMDLARHQRRVPSQVRDQVLADGLSLVQRTGLNKRWKEMDYHSYALGFLAEALYQTHLNAPRAEILAFLAETVLDLEDSRMGLPPSLLGSNAECTPVAQQSFVPWPGQTGVRLVNFSRQGKLEFLLVNSTAQEITCRGLEQDLSWCDASGASLMSDEVRIPARSWIHGHKEG